MDDLVPGPDLDLDLDLLVLLTFGTAAGLAGDHERAGACVREMLAIVEPRGERFYHSLALWLDGLIAWLRGELRQAAARELESLQFKRAWASEDWFGLALCLEVLAWITVDQQHHRRAATLLGAADARWTDVGTPITAQGHFIGHHDACERRIRDALGDAAFHHGQALTYDDAIAYALGE